MLKNVITFHFLFAVIPMRLLLLANLPSGSASNKVDNGEYSVNYANTHSPISMTEVDWVCYCH